MTVSEKLVTQKEKASTLRSTLSIAYQDADMQPFSNHLKLDKFFFLKLSSEEIGAATPINIFTDQNTLLIQFCLKGNVVLKNSSQRKSAIFKQAEYNIIFLPKGETTIIHNDEAELGHIYLSEEFFLRYMPKDHSVPFHNLQGIGKLFPKNLHVSLKFKSILSEIADCDFARSLKKLYTKGKIIELLSLQLAQYEEEKVVPATLKPLEVEKMVIVKELIENNLNNSHTISSLARAAGTNEQYLKTHFKLLFGNTVFGHLLTCKMQKAKEMLLTGNYRITEIAEVVGYKHATHFTTAFKKFFGYLPQTLKATKIFFGTYFSASFQLEAMEILMMV